MGVMELEDVISGNGSSTGEFEPAEAELVEDEKRVVSQDQGVFADDVTTQAAVGSFGIKYLYPWQRIVIANILDGAGIKDDEEYGKKDDSESQDNQESTRDKSDEDPMDEGDQTDIFCRGKQIVLLPTGAGKSLCFLTPALRLKGPTLVLYPLLALMADQKRRMDEGGLTSVIFRGGQSEEERNENFRLIEEGARIILANPEVLQNKALLSRLSKCNIQHIAIDEAHVTSEWGDTFRPAYLTLGEIIKAIDAPVVTAFTATASPEVLERISQVLFDGKAHIVRSDSDRPNIHYNVVNAYAKKRAVFKLALECPKPLIIFCGTRDKSEDMARELAEYYGAEKVKFYHAGLEKQEKDYIEKWFYENKDAILCSTCAYGMGVDKKDIRTVIHLEPSPTAEAYIQEAGRAARDGSTADAYLVWSHSDSVQARKHPEGSRPRVLSVFAESSTCRRQVLLNALGDNLNYCDGCDVCRRNGKAPFAQDAMLAYKFIRKNRKMHTREGLCHQLQKQFNLADSKVYGQNIWEHEDIEEILSQLEDVGLIKKCGWPWKNRYSAASSGAASFCS